MASSDSFLVVVKPKRLDYCGHPALLVAVLPLYPSSPLFKMKEPRGTSYLSKQTSDVWIRVSIVDIVP